MADTNPFAIEVERVGKVELSGPGPWRVHEYGRSTFEIIDADGRSARPVVWSPLKYGSGNARRASQNVVWASRSVPNTIVTQANEAWAKAQANK